LPELKVVFTSIFISPLVKLNLEDASSNCTCQLPDLEESWLPVPELHPDTTAVMPMEDSATGLSAAFFRKLRREFEIILCAIYILSVYVFRKSKLCALCASFVSFVVK
jgi:hypothetical protein